MVQPGFLQLLMIFSFVSSSSQVLGLRGCNITSVYQFGDSHTDTGNLIRLAGPLNPESTAARNPYGETYGKPNGRYSDGLLIIDYFAEALQFPPIDPYLAKNASFENGVVFSVAGCTAQNLSLLNTEGIFPFLVNAPLDTQLDWFKSYLASTCESPEDCAKELKTSVVFLGEIGENDFTYAFFEGKSIEQATTDVPLVVGVTISAAREILSLGATRMIVSGDYPIGCLPFYLTQFKTTNSSAYDDKGCLIAYNNFQIYRNNYLQQALSNLRTEFPNATIIYGDYYNAFKYVLNNASSLGFDPNSTLKACCGKGGAYNFNLASICGNLGYDLCPNPNEYIGWDGIHMTQHANYHISQYLIRDILPQLSCPVNVSMY